MERNYSPYYSQGFLADTDIAKIKAFPKKVSTNEGESERNENKNKRSLLACCWDRLQPGIVAIFGGGLQSESSHR